MFARLTHAGLPLLILGCVAAGPPPVPATPMRVAAPLPSPSLSNAGLAQLLLERHNAQRRAAGVPPLAWDPKLAASAAAYARTMSATGQLVHSPRAARPGVGENLWVGTAGAYGPDAGIASWAAEKSDYRDGVFPQVSRTGDWLDVSHYTQMIWRTTTHVGCGLARSPRWDALVCHYSPKGNRDGQRAR
jgi:uncharacterized protein YkwD